MFIPKYEPENWRFGFEIEMLFGHLGLDRYKDLDEAYDIAPLEFCQDVAERISQLTGLNWEGTDSPPNQTGYYVVPEYDLDPISFPGDAIAGVELITPPLRLNEAEELRAAIVEAVEFEGGFVWPTEHMECGWHVNADPGPEKVRNLSADHALPAFWEGEAEVETLMHSGRYQSSHAKPQHHSYGPRLLTVMNNPVFPMCQTDLGSFLLEHCGRSKYFATNLGKLEERGYLELRHFGLNEFMDLSKVSRISELFDSTLRSFTIAPSNSGPFESRLLRRFQLLKTWLDALHGRFEISTTEMSFLRGREGKITFDGEVLGTVIWNGTAKLYLEHRSLDEDWGEQRLSLLSGMDADDVLSGIAVLALDAVYAERVDCLRPIKNRSFSDEISKLKELIQEADLFPSQSLLRMGG